MICQIKEYDCESFNLNIFYQIMKNEEHTDYTRLYKLYDKVDICAVISVHIIEN